MLTELEDAFGPLPAKRIPRRHLPAKKPDSDFIEIRDDEKVKSPKKGKKMKVITVEAEVHNECTPSKSPLTSPIKNSSAPTTPKKVRRSHLLVTEPVNPHSVENTLVGDINSLLLQTISLIDGNDTNELLRENFQSVQTKLDTLFVKSIITDGLDLMEFKNLLDSIKITTQLRVILNDAWKEHISGLKLPEECKCLQIMENGGRSKIFT